MMASLHILQSLTQLPPLVNPYTYLLDVMQAIVFPTLPASDPVYTILIVSAVVYIVIFALAVSIVVIPFTRNQSFRQKHLWLWKKEHVAQNKKIYSYYIPNPGMAVAISQIFASILAEIFIVLSYMGFQSDRFSHRSSVSMWLVVLYVPGFFGFWFSGWSALYVYILSSAKRGKQAGGSKHFLPHPLLLNTFCIGVPIVVMIVAFGYGITSLFSFHSQFEAFARFVFTVQSLAAHWTPPNSPAARLIDYNTLLDVFIPFRQTSRIFLEHLRDACLAWSFFFYTVTLALLLRLMKRSLNIVSQPAVDFATVGDTEKGHSESTFLTQYHEAIKTAHLAKKLRRKYLFLVVRCSLVTLLLLWYVATGLILSIKVEEILFIPAWRVTAIYLIVFSAAFPSGSLLLQSGQLLFSREGLKSKKPQISNPILQTPLCHAPSISEESVVSVSVLNSPHVRFEPLEKAKLDSVIYITFAPPSSTPITLPVPRSPPTLPPLRPTSPSLDYLPDPSLPPDYTSNPHLSPDYLPKSHPSPDCLPNLAPLPSNLSFSNDYPIVHLKL
ncbi:hypothetical protein CROQUDRAFT_111495 [Cronartium quercuum f. sp. fusiforme G11]|uniref:Uncharacterized protein n=1 Tax=Cronartium quercuum f. sp. fusiforme G11 TaxID=708437 RepID=A0A9P6N5J9_9BASI|nr:hypothetical protein CROQUDRAFT_111495 [Cronartium quercuum f. sp. fusiforme G11]